MKKLLILAIFFFTLTSYSQTVVVCNGNYAYSWHSTANCRGLSNCQGGLYNVDLSYAVYTMNRKGCCICTNDPNCLTDRTDPAYVPSPVPFQPDWEFLEYAQQTLSARYKVNAESIMNIVAQIRLESGIILQGGNKYYEAFNNPIKQLMADFESKIQRHKNLSEYDYSDVVVYNAIYNWIYSYYKEVHKVYIKSANINSDYERIRNYKRSFPNFSQQSKNYNEPYDTSIFFLDLVNDYSIQLSFSTAEPSDQYLWRGGINFSTDLQIKDNFYVHYTVFENSPTDFYGYFGVGYKKECAGYEVYPYLSYSPSQYQFPDTFFLYGLEMNKVYGKNLIFSSDITYSTPTQLNIAVGLKYRFNKIYNPFTVGLLLLASAASY